MTIKPWIVGTVGVIWLCLGCQLSWPAAGKEYSPPPAPDIPIEDFVHRIYPRGVPYIEAIRYATGSDTEVEERVNRLLPLLVKKKEKPYWSNIVATLGIIGHPSAVGAMIEFANAPLPKSRSIDWPRVRAKRSALIALGYVINRHKEKDVTSPGKKAANTAVRFLCGRLGQKNPCDLSNQSELETANKIDRKVTDGKSKRKKNAVTPYLQQAAILGLALSGSTEGDAALRALEKAGIKEAKISIIGKIRKFFTFLHREASDYFPFSEEVENVLISQKKPSKKFRKPRVVTPIREARSAHKAIRQNGLGCYYDPKLCKTH